VRARLRKAAAGEQIQFICDTDVAAKMDRVIIFADGKIVQKTKTDEGVVIRVEKT
jgi:hypothetical protein